MALKTIKLTRKIRDTIYDKIKNMSKEEQKEFYRKKASELHDKLRQTKKTSV